MAPFTNLNSEADSFSLYEIHLLRLLRRGHKSDDVLEGKPAHKDSLGHLEEIIVLLCNDLEDNWRPGGQIMGLTQHFAVLILLVEVREGGEDEAEGGDDHEHAGHHRHHLEQGGG